MAICILEKKEYIYSCIYYIHGILENARGIGMNKILTGQERSRRYFILEGITGIGQFSLTTGNFLAGFISFLGGSETLNGRIGVIHVAMGIFQIFSTLILSHGQRSRKEKVIGIAIILRLFMSIAYFVPYILMQLGASDQVMMAGFIVCFVLAYISNGIISPIISSWMIDLSPLHIRGKYLAYREKLSLGIVAICTIVLGRVLDYNKLLGQEFVGFLFLGGVLVVMGILNIYALIHIEDVVTEETRKESAFIKRLCAPIKDPVFSKIILMYVIWNFGLFIGAPFMSVYMVDSLNLSYTYMMTMTVITTVTRVAFTSWWGNLADKKSWFLSGTISVTILGLAHFSWGFITSANYMFLIPLVHIAGGIAWAGAGISLFNMQFLFAKQRIRTMSVSVNSAIGGLTSIIAVFVGSHIVDIVGQQGMRWTFFLSGLIIMLCPLYIQKILTRLQTHIVHD